jgi:hypothetical protein
MSRLILPILIAVAGQTFAATAHADFPEGFLWGTAISGFQTDMGGARPTPTQIPIGGRGRTIRRTSATAS